MKCSGCGAEINDNSRYCEFCGTEITYEMKREQEQLNKSGCPKCGSSNVEFNREKQGEIKGKKGTAVVRSTVGICKDCGHTWHMQESGDPNKKRKTWLWVLGWIFIFPLPLTILLMRSSNKLNQKVKYAIIAAAWIVYLGWIIGSNISTKKEDPKPAVTENQSDIKSQNYEVKEEKAVEEPVEEKTKKDAVSSEPVSKDAELSESEDKIVEESEDEIVEESEADEESRDTNAVDPDLKAFLDSYEAYMDEYCEFMRNYDASDTAMLLKYTEMLEKYADFMEKADAYNPDEMSAADSLYYLQVMNRVNEKLAKVALEQ